MANTNPRRRDTFRDLGTTMRYAEKLGTYTAKAFVVVVDRPDVDYVKLIVLLGAAHHADLMRVAGKAQVTYAADVAEITGFSEKRTSGVLADLRRKGLLAGSAAAGYTINF